MFYDIEKVRSFSGSIWLRFIASDFTPDPDTIVVPASIFDQNRPAAFRRLAAIGIELPGRKAQYNVLEKISQATLVNDPLLIDASGWQGEHFVFYDGTYCAPTKAKHATIAFADKQSPPCAVLDAGWSSSLVPLLADHPAMQFAVLLALAPVIARFATPVGDVLVEFAGGDDQTRSLIGAVANAAFGDSFAARDGTTSIAILLGRDQDNHMRHHDRLAIANDADLMFSGERPAQRMARVKELVRLFRSHDRNDPAHAHWIASVSRRSMLDQFADEHLKQELRSRIVTLSPPNNAWLALKPDAANNVHKTVDAVQKAIRFDKGGLGLGFIHSLVERRHADSASLTKTINRHRRKFRKKHASFGVPASTLDMFANVYAVGVLAREAELIPQSWSTCSAAILRDWLPYAARAIDDVLQGIADQPATVRLGGDRPSTPDAIAAAAFINVNGKSTELLIRTDRIQELIPRWKTYKRTPECLALMRRDGDRTTVKRKLGGKPERVLCFKLKVKT